MKVKDLIEQLEELNAEIHNAVNSIDKVPVNEGIELFKKWIEIMNTEIELKS